MKLLADIINSGCLLIFPVILGYMLCTCLGKRSTAILCMVLPIALYLFVYYVVLPMPRFNNIFAGSEIGGFMLLGFFLFSIGSAVGAWRLYSLRKRGREPTMHSRQWFGCALALLLMIVLNHTSQIAFINDHIQGLALFAPGTGMTVLLTILLVAAVGFAVGAFRNRKHTTT